MTDTDTSAAAVERLAAFHALSADRYCADEESGLRACAVMTAATLRALLTERDAARRQGERWDTEAAASKAVIERLRAEREEAIDQRNAADFVLALSIEQSNRHSVERDEARAEVERLRTALRDLLADAQNTNHICGDADCPVALARAALTEAGYG
ncbi:hypothetical protein [Falsiroseomonas sp.]|uniref:hypothetical protein n=1 Tax=Falsiroseomonas sp. TaxID=2870721 RepID=UPI0034A48DDC